MTSNILPNGSHNEYNGALTREQFLFHEMRVTAKLMAVGLSDSEILTAITRDNLFQLPTERSVNSLAKCCLKRLHALNDADLVQAIVQAPSEDAKQICLYAMMKQNLLVWDFMVTVIGEKYRLLDRSFRRMDLNIFFTRLQEQNDSIAGWSDQTIQKIKSVLVRVLVENDYLDSTRAERLNPILITPLLEHKIRKTGDIAALPAFNCLL